MTNLEPSCENARSRKSHPPWSVTRQRIDSWPESRSYRVTALGSEVAARRLRTGEKATRPGWGRSPPVKARTHRLAGTSHKPTRPSHQPTARLLPSGEKPTENPCVGRLVSVTGSLPRVSCQR